MHGQTHLGAEERAVPATPWTPRPPRVTASILKMQEESLVVIAWVEGAPATQAGGRRSAKRPMRPGGLRRG